MLVKPADSDVSGITSQRVSRRQIRLTSLVSVQCTDWIELRRVIGRTTTVRDRTRHWLLGNTHEMIRAIVVDLEVEDAAMAAVDTASRFWCRASFRRCRGCAQAFRPCRPCSRDVAVVGGPRASNERRPPVRAPTFASALRSPMDAVKRSCAAVAIGRPAQRVATFGRDATRRSLRCTSSPRPHRDVTPDAERRSMRR